MLVTLTDDEFAAEPTGKRVGYVLRSWRQLNLRLGDLTEAEVRAALAIEEANRRRKKVLERLRQRLGRKQAQALSERAL